jgi:hypothetical protein
LKAFQLSSTSDNESMLQYLHERSLLGVHDLGAGGSAAAAFAAGGAAAQLLLLLTTGSAFMLNPLLLDAYCDACFTATGL